MTYNDLVDLVKIGEGYTIEFKERLSDAIAKDMCAFANSSGGKIILGIDDKTNRVKGFRLTNDIKSKIQSYARNIDPSLTIAEPEQIGDLVVIYVPEGKDKPYFVNGRCYIRQGATSQQLTRDEILNFFQRTNALRFDIMLNNKFSMDKDLSHSAFDRFLSEANIDKSLSREHILRNLNLWEDNRMVNAGVLFFAKSIRRFFLNSVITAVLYQGYERIEILDRQDFEEDFITNLYGVIRFLLRNLRVRSVIQGLKRYDIPEFPEEILREVVLNAMVHRDYFSEGRILVEIFKDRVEVSNPGGLLFDSILLGKKSITRNPLLADLVFRIGLVEKIGSGINKIKRVLGDSVVFEDEDDGFRVTLHRQAESPPEKTTHELPRNYPETTQKILQLIKENKFITRKEIAQKLGNITEDGVKYHLNKLKQLGVIRRVGPDRGGWWEVIEE